MTVCIHNLDTERCGRLWKEMNLWSSDASSSSWTSKIQMKQETSILTSGLQLHVQPHAYVHTHMITYIHTALAHTYTFLVRSLLHAWSVRYVRKDVCRQDKGYWNCLRSKETVFNHQALDGNQKGRNQVQQN